ncbi:MAG: RNA methyltransferase [Eubacteriales bacterium]|nr:RNA methyltransferase [Eubacteriales bacterium]
MKDSFPENLQRISSAENPSFKAALKLLSTHGQAKSGAILLSGWRELSQAISLNCQIDYIFLDESPEALDFWRSHQAKIQPELVRILSPALYRKLCFNQSEQWPIAVMRVPEADFEQVDLSQQERILVLDRVQDPGNVGTLLRTAAAFSYNLVLLTEGSARLSNPKLWRAAAGSLGALDLYSGLDPLRVIEALKSASVEVLLADLDGLDPAAYLSTQASNSQKRPRALILGNEGRGPGPEFRAEAEQILTIPISKDAESLNVGIAGGILMYLLA